MTKQSIDLRNATIRLSRKTMDKFNDPWNEPLPEKVIEMYKRDYKKLLEEEKTHPKKPIYTAEQFIKSLHEEIGQCA